MAEDADSDAELDALGDGIDAIDVGSHINLAEVLAGAQASAPVHVTLWEAPAATADDEAYQAKHLARLDAVFNEYAAFDARPVADRYTEDEDKDEMRGSSPQPFSKSLPAVVPPSPLSVSMAKTCRPFRQRRDADFHTPHTPACLAAADGIQRFCTDIGIDACEDPAVLVMSWYMSARHMGHFTRQVRFARPHRTRHFAHTHTLARRMSNSAPHYTHSPRCTHTLVNQEFCTGLAKMRCASVGELAQLLPELNARLDDRAAALQIFDWVFGFVSDQLPALNVQYAVSMWEVLLKGRWGHLPRWVLHVKDACPAALMITKTDWMAVAHYALRSRAGPAGGEILTEEPRAEILAEPLADFVALVGGAHRL
jgi:hypothetical protein